MSGDAAADAGRAGSPARRRCVWCGDDAVYRAYHDREWGRPRSGDAELFEMLTLESFQAGLSWRTILGKREAFRAAFEGFDIVRVARFSRARIERLLADPSIVRHRGKLEAAVNNAARALDLRGEFGGLAAYLWRFEPGPAERPARCTAEALGDLTRTPSSERLARDLAGRGWRFFGPTTAYAFQQAAGLVNDHEEGCWVRGGVERERRRFRRRLGT